MINLTVFQAFISEVVNLLGITVIYRILIADFSKKVIIYDLLATLIITCIPFTIGTLYLVILVIYLCLYDHIRKTSNIIIDNILAMFVVIIVSSLFDLMVHYIYGWISNRNVAMYGWLIPIGKLSLSIILAILSFYFMRSKKQKLNMDAYYAFRLWKLISLLFILYICLTIIAEREGVANNYALLLLMVDFTIIIVIGSGVLNFVRSYISAQHQQQLINDYQSQIDSAHRINKHYNEIRRERHDTRNMLLSIQGYIRDHKDKEAEELLATFLQNDTVEKHYGEIDNALDKIKISGLHNLIKEKAYKIVEKGIPFSFEVNAEIDKLPGSEIKTARIIGILMDNAIEATFKQAKPYIQFALLKHSSEVYELVIANSIEQKLNINTALKFEHSTKEGHQGIGLSNVTQLVENDDHYSFSAEVKDKVIMMTCFIQGK
ncbi:GHKL domain-containing protein [Limosilactobacillus reuteri]|uniref:GHKL domain-containing protein n=1 Tax=Limosilactobacillus reuteri TaxID=1598 RepID=UPI001E592182|nr:GHKL domain-containing protein [Limosilactobacillus reuteri]MCC4347794.1 GHKL domain-containing protein [Limosilactobacillus reuteri]MCC4374979.1 GHKL domain-containing protein [Limosilactobacillus reuteri]MCC4385355.1 GHKL domain-containing protein [Limosilactobacillus reuteri]